jgi:hypothetical protein
MLLTFPFLLLLGYFLPGFFLAKYLRHRQWCASAFVISMLVLFHIIFWLGLFGVSITIWSVLPCLIAASAGAAWLARNSGIFAKTESAVTSWPGLDRLLLLSSVVVGAVLVVRLAVSPLIGFDTAFRWDFLAQKLLALGSFKFYPPLTPPDFRTYFFTDGIPPLVSFSQWWLYVSAGRYAPSLICVFVAAQFACTLAFTYGASAAIYSRRAGILALACLAACPLYFKSVVLGQETGLTALAIAATIYFVVTAKRSDDVPAMVSAGLAAALCALSREYGWIALVAGAIALLWRGHPRKQVAIFFAVATAVAAPWYVRNLILAGNPFYSLHFLGFAVNPIHDGIMQHYKHQLGIGQWTGATWYSIAWYLPLFAPIQCLAGIPGGFRHFREHGYLSIIALLLAAVWIQSAAYTSGGLEASLRVLSPAMVVLSITAAGVLESWLSRVQWRTAMAIAILACQVWTAAQGVLYPDNPAAVPLSQWPQHAFRAVPDHTEFQLRDQLVKALSPPLRVLSENAYLHAALVDRGIDVVPVWSPEVRFIFSAPAEESDRRLRELGIGWVAYYPTSMNTSYLVSASPFYASLAQRWHVRAQIPRVVYFLVPGHP